MPKQTFLNLPEEKQNWIIDCAVEEFAQNGYAVASISRIVAAAGIAKGSFYQYFEDKEDLYGHVIDYALVKRKIQVSDQVSTKLEELNLTAFIRLLIKSEMREFAQRPKILKISMDYARHRNEPVQMRIAEKYKDLSDNYFQNFIQREKARNKVDQNVDDDILSLMIFGAASKINEYAAKNGYEALTDEYVDSFVDKIEYILTHGIYSNTTQTV